MAISIFYAKLLGEVGDVKNLTFDLDLRSDLEL
jgi:hypothetical protein